ncbi:superoxide dismutase [Nakamurella endophytica]|uniref:Superoxide dismutase n=1 Tax=Nakamurella endophytica TaxID=1748367 RepID=A0A917SQS5_9ACTN|nr:superoxide dismutase [Nakamurella endophytica]GGL91244.1 hypothetical protein GCM10011594_08670 [Nakamurella endophytica]
MRGVRGAVRAVLAVATSGLLLTGGGVALAAPAVHGGQEHGHGQDQEQGRHGGWPDVVALPDGFQPEGISIGRGTSFYVGSVATGAIYRGDLRTGRGAVLVPGAAGRAATGTEVDARNRLWVSGAGTGTGTVYDARTGALLRSYRFVADPAATPTFVNDVVVTRDAAYFTDSLRAVLYVVPIGRGGALGTARTLPLHGDLVLQPGFNLNGIEASPDGRTLLAVQSNTGLLLRISPATGQAQRVDLGGVLLTDGDGLLRQGRDVLYVVQNQLNRIAVLVLDPAYRSGRLVSTLTDPDFAVPTTIARRGGSLYAVNARFGTPPTPDTAYTVVRVDAVGHRGR